ncbi:hypothetical protein ASG87_18635 [Frateuria sp. Soil773]|nr:hypothetical protein ASG87_18635 [Frateuria sp. Soil773]
MLKRHLARVVARSAWGWMVACSLVHAQAAQPVTPEEEYKKNIRVSEDIQPLGENPFGESISLYTGGLSFEQTDISLRGTGPTLSLSRRYELPAQGEHIDLLDNAFGSWDLDLPRITTITANQQNVTGWVVAGGNKAICNNFSAPPSVNPPLGDTQRRPWAPSQWWHGYQLVIPGLGSQDLLKRGAANTLAPAMVGMTFPIVTKQHWQISCLLQAENDSTREAFLAVAPDGTKYWFNHLVYRYAPNMDRGLNSVAMLTMAAQGGGMHPMAAPSDFLLRREASMLVTRIEDRFGNALVYSYDSSNRLTGITAPGDGRALSVQYSDSTPLIRSITLQPGNSKPRTWTYTYDPGVWGASSRELARVTLPDASFWEFKLSTLTGDAWVDTRDTPSICNSIATPNNLGTSYSGSITHPSGLKGTFTVTPVKRGRSYVVRSCWAGQVGGSNAPTAPNSFATTPSAWYAMAISQRQYSGAGMPTRTWTYAYSPSNESWTADSCASAGTCPTTVWTDETDPNGDAIRRTFSNKYDASESLLLSTDYYAGAVGGSLIRSEVDHYANPTGGPWPASLGSNPQSNINKDQTTTLSPQDQRSITQEGDTYKWQAEGFNEFAQVTKAKRWNTIAGQGAVEEQTSYLNDLPHWLLGLPLQTDNLTTGEVVSSNAYDSSAILQERSSFGRKVMSYAFDSKGRLTRFADGNEHATTLGSYKLGIPQAIGYPDGTSQSLTVDDFAQIKSITDQANFTTSYDYDPVGRLTSITYPSGDEQAWHQKTFAYDFVAGSERGIGGSHWRRTMTRGDQRQVTYFSAELQPVLSDTYIDGRADSHSNVRRDFDYKGQATFVSYPKEGVPGLGDPMKGTHNTFDAIGRQVLIQQDSELPNPLTTRIDYLSGARKQVTDPGNHVTTSTFQVFDTPSYETVLKVQAPEDVTQTIVRDVYGNPLSIAQAGTYGTTPLNVTRTLAYDAYHRLCRTTEPESGSEVMSYDNANNILWSAAGQAIGNNISGCGQELVADAARTTRTYDVMNRVKSIVYPGDTDGIDYEYWPTGSVKTAKSGIALWTYEYNGLSQLKAETLDVEGYHWPVRYAHDPYGSVASVTYPDGKQIGYAPDALGRATKAGAYASDIAFFPDGNVQYYRLGNGTEYLAEENDRRSLGSINYFHGGTTSVIAQQYTYDPSGNLLVVDDQVNNRRDKTFGYDALNRLTSAQAPNLWQTETYRYDPLNNLRELNSDGINRVYAYDASNRLATIKNGATVLHSYAYDPQGNVSQKDGASLLFDKANRLTQIVGVGSYAYDASGRRVKKTGAAGNETYYAYNNDGKLLYQFDASTGVTTDYVYLGRNLVAEVRRNNGDIVLNPPSAIYFDASPNDGSYTVSWYAVGTASYELQESYDGGATWQGVYSGTASSKNFSGKAGGSYLYRVRACQGECSEWRSSATLGVRPVLAAITVPSGIQGASVVVGWARPASAASFDVEEQKSGGTWVRVATDTTATSITRTNLAAGSYLYRVSAKNGFGSRGWAVSGAVTVLYPPAGAPAVSVPASSSTGGYTVSWNAVAGANRYVLQEQLNGGAWSTAYDGAGLSMAFSGRSNGAKYGYRVQACNAAGCSVAGAAATVMIAIPPPAPTGVYANDLVVNAKLETITLVWNASAGATSYEVENADTGVAVTSTTGTSIEVERGFNEPIPHNSYAVRACNAYACSSWVSASHRYVYMAPSTAPSLSVPGSSTGSYTVSWGSVYQAATYTLQESANGGAWTTVYSNSGQSMAFNGRAIGSYGYRVRASNSGGDGPWSATATVPVSDLAGVTGLTATVKLIAVQVDSLNAGKPDATSVSAKAIGETVVPMAPPPPVKEWHWFISANWNAAANATRYEVKVEVLETASTNASVTTYNVTTLYLGAKEVPGSAIVVSVRPCNARGCAGWSSPVTATVVR